MVTIEDEAEEVVGLKAVIKFHDEGVIQHRADVLLVGYYRFFLIIPDKVLADGFERIEFPVSQAPYQVHFAEPSDCQTFDDVVLLQRGGAVLVLVFQAF